MYKASSLIFLLIIIFLVSSCNTKEIDEPKDDDDSLTSILNPPGFFPDKVYIPADNKLTPEKIRLGHYLFYDGRISGSDCSCGVNCADCHYPSSAFANTENYGQKNDKFNTISLVNTVFNRNNYFWRGEYSLHNSDVKKQTIENIVDFKIKSTWALNSSEENAIKYIKNIDYYPQMFNAAFGSKEITYDRVVKAIASFVRSIVSYDSKFHKWIRKEQGGELTSSELRGYEIFMSTKGNCFHCHGLNASGNSKYYNIGLYSNMENNRGRFEITNDSNDFGAFRVPSLINVAITPPYMHNGLFFTIEQVIDFYSEGIHNTLYTDAIFPSQEDNRGHFTETEKEDLAAFLRTLTDHSIKDNPNYLVPDDL